MTYNTSAHAIEAAIDEMVAGDEDEAVVTIHGTECRDDGPCRCRPGAQRFLLVPPARVGDLAWFMRHLDTVVRYPHHEPFT